MTAMPTNSLYVRFSSPCSELLIWLIPSRSASPSIQDVLLLPPQLASTTDRRGVGAPPSSMEDELQANIRRRAGICFSSSGCWHAFKKEPSRLRRCIELRASCGTRGRCVGRIPRRPATSPRNGSHWLLAEATECSGGHSKLGCYGAFTVGPRLSLGPRFVLRNFVLAQLILYS
jgi:hypothetical protein